MKKIFLISFNTPDFFGLRDYVHYDLELEIVWFWGLFKTRKMTKYRVYDHEDVYTYIRYWEMLIKERKPLKI